MKSLVTVRKSIFISHTKSDKPFIRRLASDLENQGIRYWFDEAEIKVGESLIEKIRQGLDDVDYVGAVLSPASVASPWVQRELDVAMNQEILGKRVKMLPILYKACELPGFLLGKFYADFTNNDQYEESLQRLVTSMDVVFNKSALQAQACPALPWAMLRIELSCPASRCSQSLSIAHSSICA